jgi:hypothetical protein
MKSPASRRERLSLSLRKRDKIRDRHSFHDLEKWYFLLEKAELWNTIGACPSFYSFY